MTAKTPWPWHAPDGASGAPFSDPLHEPAARQALDNLLAMQMQLELATGVPVAIYGPTGQALPGISPVRFQSGEQATPLARDLLAPQSWPQSIGQMLEVTYGRHLHFYITPFILRGVPHAQIILGPLQLFEPGAQDSRADRTEPSEKITSIAGVPVLASWKAQAAAELVRTMVSSVSTPASESTPRLAPPEKPLALSDQATAMLSLPGNTRQNQPTTALRLGALAQDARLPERAASEQPPRVIESPQMLQPPEDYDPPPSWPSPPRLLSASTSQAESKQGESSLLRSLIEAMPQAVIVSAAPDGQIVLANQAARRLWPRLLGGQASGDSTSAPFRSRVSIDHYPPEWLGLSIALRQGGTFRAEVSVEDAENESPASPQALPAEQAAQRKASATDTMARGPGLRPMLISAFPLPIAQGTASLAVAIFEDLSGLLERERFKDEFIMAAAHDARNPLTLISSHTQLLERAVMQEISSSQGVERARGRLAEIQAQVQSLTDLTGQLYIVTRLQSAQPRSQVETMNLARLIQRAAIDQQMLTPGRTIETIVEQDPCLVQGDPAQIQQVVMHLLKNAVRYSHPGKPISISLRCAPENNPLWAEVSVRDQGIGIPRASLPHIFERFYRVIDNEQRARVAGIPRAGGEASSPGLGLYLCKQLIERIGGRIWAESEEGLGTIVSFSLPLKR